ncbi:RICIN domain-containing protein [Roseobacter sp.]|uniref:RICIN domain-containing protein n=1 Tax=Roseobacter sp. TaxID=1907202 RepID=UPI00345038D5
MVEGCSCSHAQMRFRRDAGGKHLVHVATGKCANVRAGSKEERANIILYKYQGSAEKFANDRWTMQNIKPGWISFKSHKSSKCIPVNWELSSGRRLTQSDCSQRPGKAIVRRFVMR